MRLMLLIDPMCLRKPAGAGNRLPSIRAVCLDTRPEPQKYLVPKGANLEQVDSEQSLETFYQRREEEYEEYRKKQTKKSS